LPGKVKGAVRRGATITAIFAENNRRAMLEK